MEKIVKTYKTGWQEIYVTTKYLIHWNDDVYGKHETKLLRYTKERLQTFNTRQLLGILDSARRVRRVRGKTIGHRCCEICNEYTGSDWKNEVQPHLDVCDEYLTDLKELLSTREHVPNKKEAKELRRAKAKQGR